MKKFGNLLENGHVFVTMRKNNALFLLKLKYDSLGIRACSEVRFDVYFNGYRRQIFTYFNESCTYFYDGIHSMVIHSCIDSVFEECKRNGIKFITCLNNKQTKFRVYNLQTKKFLSDNKWFGALQNFKEGFRNGKTYGFAVVKQDGLYNLINHKGEFVLDFWANKIDVSITRGIITITEERNISTKENELEYFVKVSVKRKIKIEETFKYENC